MIFDYSLYKILVIDDIPTNVLLLKVMLEQEGYKVITANGGQQAFELINMNRPDLVLLDVLMPEMDGFEFAKKIKNEANYKDIPIIFLTALDKPSEVAEGFKVGGHDFVSKPFNKIELLARVRHQISLIAAKRVILKQTEELKCTIAARDKLYSVIAHDLRTPMSSMKMILNALCFNIDKNLSKEEFFEELQSANKIAEELFSLLDNLLKWTRSQLGLLKPILQDYNLVDLTKGVIEVFEILSTKKNITISFNAPQEAFVHIDIDMIKVSIRNLLSNAMKYSYPGKNIEVKIQKVDDYVSLDVIDHGCGINEENLNNLLDVKTHITTFGTNQEEGSGLGLLLVKEFLALNNGKLCFVSEEGVGSTFTVILPLVGETSTNE